MTVTPVTDRMADFAAQAQLTEMPDRVTRRARDLVRICVGAGARAAATSEALALHELLAGLDETPPPPEAAGPSAGAAWPVVPLDGGHVQRGLHGTGECRARRILFRSRSGKRGRLLRLRCRRAGAGDQPVAPGGRGRRHRDKPPDRPGAAAGTRHRMVSAAHSRAHRAAVAVVKALGGGLAEFRQAIGLAATQAAGLAGPASLSAAGVLAGKTASDGWEAGLRFAYRLEGARPPPGRRPRALSLDHWQARGARGCHRPRP